jgi:hypothetical protein
MAVWRGKQPHTKICANLKGGIMLMGPRASIHGMLHCMLYAPVIKCCELHSGALCLIDGLQHYLSVHCSMIALKQRD